MSQRLRLATFSFENLFTRAQVLNLADHESATSILAQIADLDALLAQARYNLATDWVVVAGDLNDTPDSKPGRFSWEGSDCEADASASRGVSEARAGARPVTSEQRRSCGSRSSQHDRSN